MSSGEDSALGNPPADPTPPVSTTHPPPAHARVMHTPQTQDGQPAAPGETPRTHESPDEDAEEALEWHEVIELQAFSERKAWIEEKAKFLGTLPPIQVFVGLDAIRASSTVVPGLPTRKELDEWFVEHDRIEKETEIFDSGELNKLRKFTKAAAQRHLSPADTDLIELTLTTIFELDKLLHLLRDRSDNLELLRIRLTWEEKRIASWTELRSIIGDLDTFLKTRARWSPAVYERSENEEEPAPPTPVNTISPPFMPTLRRRGSAVSLASAASDSIIPSLGLSRGDRFKLAEVLSRDAALFSGRVSSLKHSKVTVAGKALDKLIDESRRPVPDELLDEQDKLEDKAINELEDIGKFIMSIVMQWKKADDIYVETVKDKVAAETLLEEIEIAKLHHPNARQAASFAARSTAVVKRLEMRGNPALPSSFFPRPTHHLFPEQESSNEEIVQLLASEIAQTKVHAMEAETAAKEYLSMFDAVKKVEGLTQTASVLAESLQSVITLLTEGSDSTAGDGSPPDLSTPACLPSSSHRVYLAFLPSTLDKLQKAQAEAKELLIVAERALEGLTFPGIDENFVKKSSSSVDSLAEVLASSEATHATVTGKVESLDIVRRLWTTMAEIYDKLDGVQTDVLEAIHRDAWKPEKQEDAALLTPESPASVLPEPVSAPQELTTKLDPIESALRDDAVTMLDNISSKIGPPLRDYLSQCTSGLQIAVRNTRRIAEFCAAVQRQASEMGLVQDDTSRLQLRIEELRSRCEEDAQRVLSEQLPEDEVQDIMTAFNTELDQIREEVEQFQDSLPRRVPFVASSVAGVPIATQGQRRVSLSSGFSLDAIKQAAAVGLPIDPALLDKGVRSDSNRFSMLLAGELEDLSLKVDYCRLTQVARSFDDVAASIKETVRHVCEAADSLTQSVDEAAEQHSLDVLSALSDQVDQLLKDHDPLLTTQCPKLRALLERLDQGLVGHDHASNVALSAPRHGVMEDVEQQVFAWRECLEVLSERISDMRHLEQVRLAEEKRAREEAERQRIEEERRREEAERQRIEAERQAELDRLEAERQAELDRIEAERQAELNRIEAERQAELVRLQAERQAELDRLEAARQAELDRLEAERLAQEKAEVESLVVEMRAKEEARLQQEMRAREEEERLRQEAQAKLERERAALEALEAARQNAAALSEPECFDLDDEDDVFGTNAVLAARADGPSRELSILYSRIIGLRKRLAALHLGDLTRPNSRGTDSLPTEEYVDRSQKDFDILADEINALPNSVPQSSKADMELRSLRSDLEAAVGHLRTAHQLVEISAAVRECDNALSDLLEHIDSYPAPPAGVLSSSHHSDVNLPPEDQMSDRLVFTKNLVDALSARAAKLSSDTRVVAEVQRITQTWDELNAMGMDRVSGDKSRPTSAMSSVNGRATPAPPAPVSGPKNMTTVRKNSMFGQLARGPGSGSGKYLAPPPVHPRRTVSNSSSGSRPPSQAPSRASSRASMASTSTRSVSGPINTPPAAASRLFTSTFASRQRSSSISSSISSVMNTDRRGTPPITSPPPRTVVTRPRARTGQSYGRTERVASPALSEAARSRSSLNLSRSTGTSNGTSTSKSTWSRAPRQSFPNVPKASPPIRKTPGSEKKPYIANPKNKLDVAVGDVVNSLPVNISIEVVAETWKDQSGKYWIGDEDPKLCFCRILRSQTVMVRVGGGWSELSRFIKEHFADAFRLVPESPPAMGAREEKWISSATLAEGIMKSPPMPPTTPEPDVDIPSFALSTPSGNSPRSLTSTSPGSPRLQPIQFIRRADRESPALVRPETPTKPPRSVTRASTRTNTPRAPAWRP